MRERIHRQGHKDDKDAEISREVFLCQQGDMAAMEKVYERYRVSLFNLVFRMTNDYATAEELLQDIFIKAFSNIVSLRHSYAFKSWIYRLAINTCNSFLQNRKQERLDLSENMDHFHSQKPENGVLAYSLRKAITSLAPRLRAVFVLHEIQGFNHDEIAATLGCNIGTSKSQLFKARKNLRYLLMKGGEKNELSHK